MVLTFEKWINPDDGFLVHQTRDPSPPMHLVLLPRLGWHHWILHLHGYLEALPNDEARAMGIDLLHPWWCDLSLGHHHMVVPARLALECALPFPPRATCGCQARRR